MMLFPPRIRKTVMRATFVVCIALMLGGKEDFAKNAYDRVHRWVNGEK